MKCGSGFEADPHGDRHWLDVVQSFPTDFGAFEWSG